MAPRVTFSGRVPSLRFKPLDGGLPVVVAHRPLALAILADYGNPADRAAQVSAIVDWVARIAIHGHSGLRLPQPYTAGTATLPVGRTWSEVQARLTGPQQDADNQFWSAFKHDAAAILNVLLGTLQPDGTRAQDGAMTQVTSAGAQAHWRYRSLDTVRSVWCTHEHDMATLLLASLGYPSMLSHIEGHDPLRVQYGDKGEWGYWCCTYNEHYAQTGSTRPLDLPEMRDLSRQNRVAEIVRVPHVGPVWDPTPYVSASYLKDHPSGVPYYGVSMDSRIVPGGIGARDTNAVDDHRLTGSGHPLERYPRISEYVATPYLGAYVADPVVPGLDSLTVRVASSQPGTVGFTRRIAEGAWTPISSIRLSNEQAPTATIRLSLGTGNVEIAPVDAFGQRGPSVLAIG